MKEFKVNDRVFSLVHYEWGKIVEERKGFNKEYIIDFGKEIFNSYGSLKTFSIMGFNTTKAHFDVLSKRCIIPEDDFYLTEVKAGDFVSWEGRSCFCIRPISKAIITFTLVYKDDSRIRLVEVYPEEITNIIASRENRNAESDRIILDLIKCANCERSRYIEDFFNTIKSQYPEFLSKFSNAVACEECGNVLLSESQLKISEGKYVCPSCYSELYTSCSCCEAIEKNTEIEKTRDGYFLCKQCRKREFILPYHRYYPLINFFGKKKLNPYLGVELEVAEGGERNNEAKKVVNIMNKSGCFAYCSHDSSIDHGFEIITQPATLEYHNSIKHIYKNLFETLLEDGYVSHDNSSCGLHVHFNRDFYQDNEEVYISHLLYLIDKFWDKVVIISRRNERKMSYTKKINIPIGKYIEKTNKSGCHDYHYYAINLINEKTIEFRMFRGTLNLNTFLATLQFVNNCIMCAKEKTAQEIQNMAFEELITGRALKAYWKSRVNTPFSEY